MRKLFIFPFILLLCILNMGLSAEEKMKIAVIDFEAKDVSKKDALKISELIRNDIISSGKFTVIERAQMGQILKEQEFQQTGCSDISCVVEMGKILSAKKILVGSVMKLGNQIIITGRIVDVEKGVAEFSDKAVADSDNEIVKAVTSFVDKLSVSINSADDEKKTPAVEKKPDSSFSKNNYLTGSLICLSLTAASFGGSFFADLQVSSKTDKYNELAVTYTSATDPDILISTRDEMNKTKKDADKYELIRNISFGAGGILTVVTGYFFYKYITFTSAVSVYPEPVLVPVFYTNLLTDSISGNEFFIEGGLSYRF